MYREWPFFTALLSNMEMVLAKNDIAIASRYADLLVDEKLRDVIFDRAREEWDVSLDALLEISGKKSIAQAVDPQSLSLYPPA